MLSGHSKALKTSEMVDEFHTDALNKSGVIISTCSSEPSGCHGFAADLRVQFSTLDSTLDYLSVNLLKKHDKTSTVDILPRQIKNKNPWECALITGCLLNVAGNIVKKLSETYNLKKLTHIYVISTPHHSATYNMAYSEYAAFINRQFSSFTTAKVSLLTSGVNCTSEHNIGLPITISLKSSEYKLAENCYGMMYNGHPELLDNEDGEAWLHAYFDQVRRSAGLDEKKITVIAIDIDNKTQISRVAQKYQIEVDYVDRLSQTDFTHCMVVISQKGGIISLDGAQSLTQALLLSAHVMFYNTSMNEAYCKQLIAGLPEELQKHGAVILGQSKDYDLLKEDSTCIKTYEAFQTLIQAAKMKFAAAKDKCLVASSVQKIPAIASHSIFSYASGQDTTNELDRITGLHWSGSKSQPKAFLKFHDCHHESLKNEVKEYLQSMNVEVTEKYLAATKNWILIVNYKDININDLRKIQPMASPQSKLGFAS